MAKSAKGRGTNRTRNRAAGTGQRNDRLADFETRLGRARGRRGDAPEAQARGSAMGTAFRISSELVVGLLVGGLIGATQFDLERLVVTGFRAAGDTEFGQIIG